MLAIIMHLLDNGGCPRRAARSLMRFPGGAGTGMGACAGTVWQAGVERCPDTTPSEEAYKQAAPATKNAKNLTD
jgi:hypothetical protein